VREKLDIAVVGAGPAGLAAALLLHRAGHRARVFERFDEPKPVGSGLILQPTGMTVLHHLGLLDEMLALGSPLERLYGVDAATGRPVLDVRYDALAGGRFGLGVHRAALFGVLHRAVSREMIEIVTGVDVVATDRAGGLIASDGRSVGRFDLVIDASGARSVLRAEADAPAEPRPLAYGALWASLRWPATGFDPHALLQRYDRASVMIGVLPIGRPQPGAEEMAAFFWSLKPNDFSEVRATGIEALKARVVSLWPECVQLTDKISGFDGFVLARYGHHTLMRPAGRRLAIIGDAAHSASPQLGQGANMALLDAAALAHALAVNGEVEDALDAYVRARRLHVRVFQSLSYIFTPFYQSDSTVLPFLRDRLVSYIARITPGPQMLAAIVAGTLVDPFKRIGLKEVDWQTVGFPDRTQKRASRLERASDS
jgi:2-polyprenyl-6-methoxyphenol hydroxylase-like FAD-dependent oxidoreductase